jgi:hypothetical protein
MSVSTVTDLSADWQEAVASNMRGPQRAFPAPWFPESKVGDYNFVPIDNSADLYREGAAMHHCVGTYEGEVQSGSMCIYGVLLAGERVATLALVRTADDKATISQLRGHCNAQVSKEIAVAARKWVRSQPKIPPRPQTREERTWLQEVENDIPF